MLSVFLCSWAGDSRRRCLGGNQILVQQWTGAVEGAGCLELRTTVSPVGTDHASYCLPHCGSSK